MVDPGELAGLPYGAAVEPGTPGVELPTGSVVEPGSLGVELPSGSVVEPGSLVVRPPSGSVVDPNCGASLGDGAPVGAGVARPR